MTPIQKHNLKWALPIIFVRAPLMLPVVAIGWFYEEYLEPFGDWVSSAIPGFRK